MYSLLNRLSYVGVVVFAVALLVCLTTQAAFGQELSEDERRATARELLDQGQRAQQAGEHVKAIGFFTKADELYPHPSHGLFLGRSYSATGQLMSAWEAYNRFIRAEPNSDKMRELQEEAQAEMDKLEPRIPKLTIHVKNAAALTSTTVLLDGKNVPEAALNTPMPINPGRHTVSIQSDTYQLADAPLELNIEEGATELVELDLQAVLQQVGEPREPPSEAPPPKTEKSKKKLLIGGVAVTSVGVIALGVGTVFLANAGAKKSDREDLFDECLSLGEAYCSASQDSELQSLADKEEQAKTGAVVTYAAGGLAVAAGVTMMVLSSRKREAQASRGLKPYVGFRSAGIVGRF